MEHAFRDCGVHKYNTSINLDLLSSAARIQLFVTVSVPLNKGEMRNSVVVGEEKRSRIEAAAFLLSIASSLNLLATGFDAPRRAVYYLPIACGVSSARSLAHENTENLHLR